jgi:predicted nucleotidyltransferase
MRTICKMYFGSHVYGTDTKNSDIDFKGIYFPSKREVLLGRVPKSLRNDTNKTNSKNTKDDIDEEMYSIHHFFKLASEGQTVALDLLFTPPRWTVEKSSVWERIRDNRHLFLSKDITSFVGYAKRQAAKYGIKGSRLSDATKVAMLLSEQGLMRRLEDVWEQLPETENLKKRGPDKTGAMLYDVCGKLFQSTAKCLYVYESLMSFISKYGHKAKLASMNEGIDWKAVSHAFRACYEMQELLQYETITFPLKQATFLGMVKQGELEFGGIENLLENNIDRVYELAEISDLPEHVNKTKIDDFLEDILYREYCL